MQFLQQADAHVVKEPLPPIPSGDDQQGENIIDKHVSYREEMFSCTVIILFFKSWRKSMPYNPVFIFFPFLLPM